MKTSNKILAIGLLIIIGIAVIFGIASRVEGDNKKIDISDKILQSTTKTSQFSFQDFNQVETSGNWEVKITQGDKYQIKIFAAKDIADKVLVEQEGDSLLLSMKPHFWNSLADPKIQAEITMPALSKISTSGATDIYFRGFTCKNLTLSTFGQGTIFSKNNNITNLIVDDSGASNIVSRNDQISNLSLKTLGAAKIDFIESIITNASLELSGANEIKLNMAGGIIKGKISGAASVVYKGEVKSQDLSTSGMATIHRVM